VSYGMEVEGVSVGQKKDGKVSSFVVTARDHYGVCISLCNRPRFLSDHDFTS
jgi:hypothetical protein